MAKGDRRIKKLSEGVPRLSSDDERLDPGEVAAVTDALAEAAGAPPGREPLEDSPELQELYREEGRVAFYKRLDDFVARPGLCWSDAQPWERPAPRIASRASLLVRSRGHRERKARVCMAQAADFEDE